MSHETILSCGHPYSKRWVSTCGWVEVCGCCSEIRDTAEPHRASVEPWPSAGRLVRRVGDELLMYGKDGKRLYRRDPV